MATTGAISAIRDAFTDPNRVASVDFAARRSHFDHLWHLYRNSVYDDQTVWQAYREKYVLYRNVRAIYNPTKRLVNFYVAQVYPGVLSEDAKSLPDGVPLAIPLSGDTSDDLKAAVAQFWQWSNWQSKNKLMVRYGAATGCALVEMLDDPARGKVSASVRWPGLVADLVLDDAGNVKSYAVEYDAEDEGGKAYKYRKEVDGESFRYFKDDKPFAYGGGEAVVPHPYTFCPAVWCKHTDEGEDIGAPAIAGSVGKIDELNSIASHVSDHIDVLIDSPGIIATEGKLGRIGENRTTTADEYDGTTTGRGRNNKRLLLKAPKDTSWIPMSGNLDPEKAEKRIESLYAEIERDHPELKFWETVRGMSSLSGVAVDRLSGDVRGRVGEAAANYDQQSVKLFAMAAAIGGFRLREGREGWRNPTEQQQKFGPFDLTSYGRGELSMSIMPRPLVPATEAESVELTGKRLENARRGKEVFDEDRVLELAGISDEKKRKEIIANRQTADQAQGLTRIAARIAAGAQGAEVGRVEGS